MVKGAYKKMWALRGLEFRSGPFELNQCEGSRQAGGFKGAEYKKNGMAPYIPKKMSRSHTAVFNASV